MNDEQINLVKSSWSYVLVHQDDAAAQFYGRLFEVAPGVRPLFTTDVKEQGKKLVSAISLVVGKLHKLEDVLDQVKYLGKKHATEYGAKPEHYPVVASVLLEVLEKGNGDKWTPAHKEAWSIALNTVANAMIEAGKE